jgi:hypothetical protein
MFSTRKSWTLCQRLSWKMRKFELNWKKMSMKVINKSQRKIKTPNDNDDQSEAIKNDLKCSTKKFWRKKMAARPSMTKHDWKSTSNNYKDKNFMLQSRVQVSTIKTNSKTSTNLTRSLSFANILLLRIWQSTVLDFFMFGVRFKREGSPPKAVSYLQTSDSSINYILIRVFKLQLLE